MDENKAKNAAPLDAGLYVVATPIGNLSDITLRALEVLKGVNCIYCEDTRTSGKLMQAYAIKTSLQPYHEHNALKQRPQILQRLQQGHSVALISDAGTPAISDPGYKLIKEAREFGFTVIPIPGASAAITALCASGLPSDNFHFQGFLPPKQQVRRKVLETMKHYHQTMVFYESPRRLLAMLQDAAETMGESRQAVVARELTKRCEEFRYEKLSDLVNYYESQEQAPKGEIVVLIQGAEVTKEMDAEAVDAMLREAMARVSIKDAAKEVAEMSGLAKRDLYQRALALKSGDTEG